MTLPPDTGMIGGHPYQLTKYEPLARIMPWSEAMDAWLAANPEMVDHYDYLKDPRLAGIVVGEMRTLKPKEMPRRGESPFLSWNYDGWSSGTLIWENQPGGYWGNGLGLPELPAMPRFHDSHSKPKSAVDMYDRGGVYLVQHRILETFCRFDAGAIEYAEADYRYSDGQKPNEPYFVMDVIQKRPAIDFLRSVINYHRFDDERAIIGGPETTSIAFIKDLPADLHLFRYARPTARIGLQPLFSRELAEALWKQRINASRFDDPADRYPVYFQGMTRAAR